ncbi:hypothetical protein OIC43_40385 [Streptomyces sp. NBC_00825]|uniref:hypothetical protein n=1 Tax=unclassified Streptomyces TaxID=2593676 RepID=UPI002ED571E2|nr:hypothetical protein OG832_03300 [Streptomyces sp. NBC_00826]WTH94859.1 hypothetical protein OIC43_40385 [Streptomyces sp. NBC_00825]WTI03593.1 hypothetical protein OHA23_40360 [Streptomyces sp. NBC_00822]
MSAPGQQPGLGFVESESLIQTVVVQRLRRCARQKLLDQHHPSTHLERQLRGRAGTPLIAQRLAHRQGPRPQRFEPGARPPLQYGPVAVGPPDVRGTHLAARTGPLDHQPHACPGVHGIRHPAGVEALGTFPGVLR